MVKLESGLGQLEIVEFLARHDIAVCAHLGLKPQSVHKTGGFTLEEEIARIGDVREAIGRETLLMLDMNAAYGLNDCIRFARGVEPFEITWLEEPLHWYLQPRDYVQLALRNADPDTLFFERRLTISGDTDVGLIVKNALDRIEPPLPQRLLQALQKHIQ